LVENTYMHADMTGNIQLPKYHMVDECDGWISAQDLSRKDTCYGMMANKRAAGRATRERTIQEPNTRLE
jgi:hypothetical protein